MLQLIVVEHFNFSNITCCKFLGNAIPSIEYGICHEWVKSDNIAIQNSTIEPTVNIDKIVSKYTCSITNVLKIANKGYTEIVY